MEQNYRWLNRTRLNVRLLENRIQPGSLFMTGPGEIGASIPFGVQRDRDFHRVSHNVSLRDTDSIRIIPVAVQDASAESRPDTIAHPDCLFDYARRDAALFADDPLTDPLALGATPQSRIVRQRTESVVMARQSGIADVASPSASASNHSRALPRSVAGRSGDAAAARVVPFGFNPDIGTDSRGAISPTQKQTIAENYGRLPLSLEQNVGQFDERVDFVTRAGGMTTFLTSTAAIFAVQNSVSELEALATVAGRSSVADASGSESSTGAALYMEIVGGNPDARAVGVSPLSGIVNYFIGNDASQWHTNIATFGRVVYEDVYRGIDLVYYGNGGALEYDFIVSPGVDPNVVALNFAGADGVDISSQGDLVLHTAAGDVVQQKPLTYQQDGDRRREISSRYVLNGTSVQFEVGAYDPTQPLVIDPLVLGYSTYLGAGGFNSDSGEEIAVDAVGNAYVTGRTESTNFPTTPGAFDPSYNGGADAFVAKLRADGAGLLYSTYLGGSDGFETSLGIAVDAAGHAYMTGFTSSTDFPTTPGAFQTSYNGGSKDAFAAKLSGDGASLDYGTYLGGSGDDTGRGIAVDAAGNAYVTGQTESTSFPTTPGAFDTSFNGPVDVFVAKVRADGTSLGYGTYLGGSSYDSGYGIGVDAAGNAYVAGSTTSANFPTTPGAFDTSYSATGYPDVFVTKLNADGTSLGYGTYLGGSGNDHAYGIAVDAAGNAYLAGLTTSASFPTTPGAFDTSVNGNVDVFVAKLSADGTSLGYGTYIGGAGEDGSFGMAVDAAGNTYVTGYTLYTDFPTTPGAFDSSLNGTFDAFVAKLSADGSNLDYGTYLGGGGSEVGEGIAVDVAGNVYVIGWTGSTNFPTTPGALKRRNRGANDAFVTKFAEV